MSDIREKFIIKLASLLRVNLLGAAHRGLGIGYSSDIENNGEEYFVKNYLPKIIKEDSEVLVDAGMNKGEYTKLLLKYFPHNPIHGFEPNPELIPILTKKFSQLNNVHIHKIAISDKKWVGKLFMYQDDHLTGHSSLNKDVFEVFHKTVDVDSTDIETFTLEAFCDENQIGNLSFIKLDIEGHEYNALKGVGKFLKNVKALQIEFNEMNILSKVFMHDFFIILENYNVYRLLQNGIMPIKRYSSTQEIFRYQNLIFINKKYDCFES